MNKIPPVRSIITALAPSGVNPPAIPSIAVLSDKTNCSPLLACQRQSVPSPHAINHPPSELSATASHLCAFGGEHTNVLTSFPPSTSINFTVPSAIPCAICAPPGPSAALPLHPFGRGQSIIFPGSITTSDPSAISTRCRKPPAAASI